MNGFDTELYVAMVATASIIINYANDVAEFGTDFSKITIYRNRVEARVTGEFRTSS